MKHVSPIQSQRILPAETGSDLRIEEKVQDAVDSTYIEDVYEEQGDSSIAERELRSPVEGKRRYNHLPEELKQFSRTGKKFKKENLRQGLARAVQILYVTWRNPNYKLKGGLLKRSPLDDSQREQVGSIMLEHSQSIAAFRSTKTCVLHLPKNQSFLEGKVKSWTTEKWEEFKLTPGIEQLLQIVIDAVFGDADPEDLCAKWKKDCCKKRKHTDECRGKWEQMKTFLLQECSAEDEETRSSTRRPPVLEESEVLFDPFFVLN